GRIDELLDELLRGLPEFDLVLIEAPPVLALDEAMALTPRVDGVVLVMNDAVKRPVLHRLAGELRASPAPLLRFVRTEATRPSRGRLRRRREPVSDSDAGPRRSPRLDLTEEGVERGESSELQVQR